MYVEDTYATASQLVSYMNNSTVNSGVCFSLVSDNTIRITGDFMNAEGYAYFGWDTRYIYKGSNVSITGFGNALFGEEHRIPEPAAWILMVLGVPAVYYLRTRRK